MCIFVRKCTFLYVCICQENLFQYGPVFVSYKVCVCCQGTVNSMCTFMCVCVCVLSGNC